MAMLEAEERLVQGSMRIGHWNQQHGHVVTLMVSVCVCTHI